MNSRDALLLSILTFVTALGWLVLDVYHASIDSTISPEVEAQLSPVTPTFEKDVVQSLKSRETFAPSEESPPIVESEAATGSAER